MPAGRQDLKSPPEEKVQESDSAKATPDKEVKAEEKPAEAPKEEPKAEEKKEEAPKEAPKAEEKPAEAPKEEAKPAPKEKKPEPKKEITGPHKELIETIKNMSVIELSELVKELEDVFGVSAAAPVAVAAGGPAAGAPAEEKTSFSVVLKAAGDKKIQVIKEVRTITGLGLKEAKALVDGAPKPVKENVKKEEAEEIKGKIEAAGGTVELQ